MFQLSAKNDEGPSKWSDVVMFRTLPDRPAPPCKPQIKGKVLSHAFTITWGMSERMSGYVSVYSFTVAWGMSACRPRHLRGVCQCVYLHNYMGMSACISSQYSSMGYVSV